MINTQQKKKRRRSKEEKLKKLQEIINVGSKLYKEKGWGGFGMRALARSLGMSEGNLYNYVKSKRELYIAIRSKYYEEFLDRLKKLINK
ncbi:MAG: TetR/AcrR family transcriptional regulator, partial [Promethearchaeota archaeon]